MNIYEDAALEQTLETLSDQLGLLVLELLLAGVQKVRRETQIYQDLSEAKTPATPHDHPF